ncbi:hypothetical protein E2C01_044130 [Portunus trituberculatus]|uniref:Uncharacterized protein n=1 Tax=Portunus trituberculatus TaxID=210409 RepID=A0A5B7FY11_PORTR|nr:hypothetical protein [Portunus trituberculatus]
MVAEESREQARWSGVTPPDPRGSNRTRSYTAFLIAWHCKGVKLGPSLKLTTGTLLPRFLASLIMNENSSAKDTNELWVMGLRGSKIFCCMSRAYIQRILDDLKVTVKASCSEGGGVGLCGGIDIGALLQQVGHNVEVASCCGAP